MEQGTVLPAGSGRRGRNEFLTLEEFRAAFARVAELRGDGLLPVARRRGDHDLNPGMGVPDMTRAASVLVPIVGRDHGLTVLLTRRSDSLPVHSGQISFPGGREIGRASGRDRGCREVLTPGLAVSLQK